MKARGKTADADPGTVLDIPVPTRAPKDRPYILANFALTADSRISTRSRTPSVFSSPLDKRRLSAIRAVCDAVMAGHGTVKADNMSMGLSDPARRAERVKRGQSELPVRVIFSNSGRIDPALKVFQSQIAPTVIFSTTRMPKKNRQALEKLAEVYCFDDRQVDLPTAMQILRREHAVKSIVCEGGAFLFRSLLEQQLLDELYLTLCPLIFGGTDAPTLTGPAGDFLSQSRTAKLLSMEVNGQECFLRYQFRK
ncbi:MAG: dihydrofolate reductase family protein [Chthoniobacteraceae bacterium]